MKWLVRSFFITLRLILTPIILFLDFITTPKGVKRAPQQQEQVDLESNNLTLYQFRACPFCIKVRRAIKRLSLNIDLLDAQRDLQNREELLQGGGKVKVPCLKITDDDGKITWLYESDEIIAYLQQRFA